LVISLLATFYGISAIPGARIRTWPIVSAIAWTAFLGVIGFYAILTLRYIALAVLDMAEARRSGR
jgi:hypothetical protein